MYIDSHAHMFFDDFNQDIGEVLRRSRDAGVSTIVVPGTNLDTSRKAISLAESFDGVYACVGFHPHDAKDASDGALQQIEELSRHPKVVAIGEIGLDFFYDYSPREQQFDVLRKQLAIAVRRNLPVVVHTRDSVQDAIKEIKTVSEKHVGWRSVGYQRGLVQGARGVFHCFSGTAEQANLLFSYGFFVSYPGIVTFKHSPALETLKSIGCEHILLETDSPFLTPVPFRGKRNEPANIPLIANKIAEVLQITPNVVAKHASANTRHLFSLP